MKTILHCIIIILCLFFMHTKLAAQQKADFKSGHLEVSYGAVLYGPANRMEKYLVANDFDARTSGWLGTIKYPVTSGTRSDLSLSYGWTISEKRQIGVELNYSSLGEITGASNFGESVELGFLSYGGGLYYGSYGKAALFKIGPALMLNRTNRLYRENFSEVKETITTTITLGLKITAEVYLWNASWFYGKIGMMYMATYATEHGPFPYSSNNGSLEAESLNFGYGSIFLKLGLKI